MLSVHGLSKSFGGLKAVQDVTFDVEPGTITALIGPNGAGKSTVFNLVSGTLKPDSGRVSLDGEDITARTPQDLARQGMSRSFQITNLFHGFSVSETLLLSRLSTQPRRGFLASLSKLKSERHWVGQHAERFGLPHVLEREIGELSHGDQRRLEIAVCMAREPRILLLDEPTQGMGARETEETEEMIASLRKQVSVLLVEHDVELVMGISDKVVVLQQGRVIADGAPDSIRGDQAVQDAYLGGVA